MVVSCGAVLRCARTLEIRVRVRAKLKVTILMGREAAILGVACVRLLLRVGYRQQGRWSRSFSRWQCVVEQP